MSSRISVLLLLIGVIVCQSGDEDLVDITQIPMFPQDYAHKIYSGYLTISPLGNKAFHYFFFER
jgi:hypothetical protein